MPTAHDYITINNKLLIMVESSVNDYVIKKRSEKYRHITHSIR